MPAPVVQILQSSEYAQEIRRGGQLLAEGKAVVLPMETVYGVTALLSHPAGRGRLKALRAADNSKPLTPHLVRSEQAAEFLGPPSELADRMMRKLWPGPVGLQFDVDAERRRNVAAKFGLGESDLFEDGTITLRRPDHAVFMDIASAVDGPVAATAAPGRAADNGRFDSADLAAELDGKVDLIFDAGAPRFNKPSTLVKLSGDGYKVVRAGVYDERTIRRLMRTTILFVCSGNTCRSPMCEALARKVLSKRFGVEERELEGRGIEVLSAGTMAMGGSRATPQGVEAVQSLGCDLSRHRSRPLTIELIQQADAIYTMSGGHSRAVMMMLPSAAQKVQRLDPENEIDDPIGGDLELYNDLARRLLKLIEARLAEGPLP